jgi:hypothetical protein
MLPSSFNDYQGIFIDRLTQPRLQYSGYPLNTKISHRMSKHPTESFFILYKVYGYLHVFFPLFYFPIDSSIFPL